MCCGGSATPRPARPPRTSRASSAAVPPPADRQRAYVLHRRAFRETSAIVELLTQDFGRVGGVVRGAKSARRGGHRIEPFGEVTVTWRGRGQLVNVLNCEPLAHCHLRGDALFAGFYVNELLVRTLRHEEPVRALFQHYARTLTELAAAADAQAALRRFERRLLEELGYGLAFDADLVSGQPINDAKTYRLVEGEGFRQVPDAVTDDGAPGVLLSGSDINAISADDYRQAHVLRAAKRVFRRALARRLDGRPLATRQLFRNRGHRA